MRQSELTYILKSERNGQELRLFKEEPFPPNIFGHKSNRLGENAAAKLMRKDMFFYPDADIYDLPLYGNQFMPLGIKATLQERVRVQAMFDGFCNGG